MMRAREVQPTSGTVQTPVPTPQTDPADRVSVVAQPLATEVVTMAQAVRDANAAVSVAQTADAGLQEIGALLTRMRDLATQASAATVTPAQRTDVDAAYQALAKQVQEVIANTRYAGAPLLDGSRSWYCGVMLPDPAGGMDGPIHGRLETQWATSRALAAIDRTIADVGNMRIALSTHRFSFPAATVRTLAQQVDLSGADAQTVDVAYLLATNSLNSVRVQQNAAHLVAVVANQMPNAAMALLYFNGAAGDGR